MSGYCGIGLMQPKTHHNVGSVIRAAHCFGASFIAIQGKRYSKAPTDPQRGHRSLPVLNVSSMREIIPYDCVPVAVDIIKGATPLHEYRHPKRAFYIFGPEDGSLGKSVQEYCRDAVFIDTSYCLNLAMAVNIILYDRSLG